MYEIDLTGQRFTRLFVIKRQGRKYREKSWLCICDCGNTCVLTTTWLVQGLQKSCGCLASEIIADAEIERDRIANSGLLTDRSKGYGIKKLAKL